ncbi:efflux RND transporter periplasmic adaptor subunit [Chitinophaga oryzae]|uniref:Efflux RND transporter periplasmic adaptor subunit n=1 Tax=Chitinophaga oryzae TaxID=2725414 RepID=A0AAE7D7R3_9BACT|nr:efflux RND transporter periplasmic adaptor subunit [Chitinophaga oryzae]QJB33090.1 efflux RND transporter periplasmic adaptor subunit [Chitinophaga oryzae]QJB39564.1 efflux RND transporter periplasmic adaptor subunit [Chitinophaga oryzae]
MRKIFIYIVITGFLYACNNQPAAEKSPAENQPAPDNNTVTLDSVQKKNAGIVLDSPRTANIHATLRATGMVDVPPQNLISISFPMGGYLKSTRLLPGSQVAKGEIIGTMEDQSYVQLQQEYLTAKANMEYLSADMDRQRTLSEADAISKKRYQQVLNEYKTAQVTLKAVGEKLRIININPDKLTVGSISRTAPIYSPINGYVTKVNVNIGRYVMPSDVLFELVNPEDIHAAITVFEKDIPAFHKGLQGKVTLVDRPDKVYDIETILVTKNISDNRSGLIHCHFENPGHDLLPGMFLNATFEMDSQQALTVPEEAVVRYMGKDYVFVTKDGNSFTLTPVNAGLKENNRIQLLPGGKDLGNEKIVTTGAYALLGKLKNTAGEEE